MFTFTKGYHGDISPRLGNKNISPTLYTCSYVFYSPKQAIWAKENDTKKDCFWRHLWWPEIIRIKSLLRFGLTWVCNCLDTSEFSLIAIKFQIFIGWFVTFKASSERKRNSNEILLHERLFHIFHLIWLLFSFLFFLYFSQQFSDEKEKSFQICMETIKWFHCVECKHALLCTFIHQQHSETCLRTFVLYFYTHSCFDMNNGTLLFFLFRIFPEADLLFLRF